MNDLTPEDLRRLNEVAERFEGAARRGERPPIEAYVGDSAGPLGREIVRHLLGVELDLRRGRGEDPTPEEYEARFPGWAGSVRAVFADANGRDEQEPGGKPGSDLTRPCAPLPAQGPEPVAAAAGPELRGYTILDVLGRGAMGVVYKGWQVQLDRCVAIKMLSDGGSTERFRREAKLIAQIRSPHVVGVHDLHTLPEGGLVLVMEYVEGTDLARTIRDGRAPLPETDVLRWMRQVAKGMLAASDRGIVHRDLKPSNILIDTHGNARVADFGLGRGPTDLGGLTHADAVIGTPYYMAPEQAEDPQSVDTRADIYSYGATFYHALTGEPPFEGKTTFSILYKHKTEPLVSPRSRNPAISSWMSELLERCLAKSPSDRFPGFAEMLVQLQPTTGVASPWEMPEDLNWRRYHEAYKASRASSLHGPPELGECDRHEFPGGRVLTILRGDLAGRRADAIVSSAAGDLRMDYGVALALRRAAGDDVARETRRFAFVRPGRVVVTSAGDLPARFVFHGVTIGRIEDDWIFPSRDLISEIMTSCFYHADTLNVKSIAFPLLGTGAGGFSREVCLDTMFRSLARMFLHGLSCIQEAQIVIFPLESP